MPATTLGASPRTPASRSTAAGQPATSYARLSRTRAERPGCARPGSRRSSLGRASRARLCFAIMTATIRAGSAGRRSSSARTRRAPADELRAYPKDLLQSPLDVTAVRRDARARAGRPVPPTLSAASARSAGPGRRRRFRLAGRPLAPERARHPRLARRRGLLGRRPRALARPRQDDRHGVPRRPARNAFARGPARPDHDRHAHGRRLHARRGDARPLAADRPGPALSVAEPGLGTARRRGRRRRPAGRACVAARTSTATATITTTATHTPHRPVGRCSQSASRADCFPARRRWSCCSQRSRCTGSRSASCSSSRSARAWL